MVRESVDKAHPILSREEATRRVLESGYVRMDGHTATNLAQLEQLYEILALKEKGLYTKVRSTVEALADLPSALPPYPGAPLPLSAVTGPVAPVSAPEPPAAPAGPVEDAKLEGAKAPEADGGKVK